MLLKVDTAERTPSNRIGVASASLFMVIAVLVAAYTFKPALLELIRRWTVQDEYSHGFLIPLISCWLLWTRRRALAARMGRAEWLGAGLIALAAGLHIVGVLSALWFLSQVGFILVLMGLTLAFGGYSLFALAAIPLALLVFAIPMPYFVDAMLSWRLQIVSSELGTAFIRLMQIPVFLEGNVIDLGTYKLQVVEACSGLRYLYPLASLGFLAAYLFRAPLWQRVLVFLSTIPITILMNSFRIGVVGVLVSNFGPQDADGFLHMFEGWIIFLACTAILIAEIFLFARFLNGSTFIDSFQPPKFADDGLPQKRPATVWTPFYASFVLICLTGIASATISSRQEFAPPHKSFATFPTSFGTWKGQVSSLDAETVAGLGLTDYVLTDYASPDNRSVNFYVAYYASQRSGVSPHSPAVCIPGNGWQVTALDRTTLKLPDSTLPINRAVIARGNDKEIVYYWFNERGRIVANEWIAKLYLLKDAIFANRTDGALIRIITPVSPNETEQDADARLRGFAADVQRKLDGYLPSQPES